MPILIGDFASLSSHSLRSSIFSSIHVALDTQAYSHDTIIMTGALYTNVLDYKQKQSGTAEGRHKEWRPCLFCYIHNSWQMELFHEYEKYRLFVNHAKTSLECLRFFLFYENNENNWTRLSIGAIVCDNDHLC